MRSVSSQISWISCLSSSPTAGSRSWAAPRMPESGFLTSCARVAASPATERVERRCEICWSSRRATEQGCSTTSTLSRQLRDRADMAVDADRLAARQRQLDAIVGDRGAARLYLADQSQYRRVRGHELRQLRPASTFQLAPKSCSAAGLAKLKRRRSSTEKTALGMLCSRTFGSKAHRRSRAVGVDRVEERIGSPCAEMVGTSALVPNFTADPISQTRVRQARTGGGRCRAWAKSGRPVAAVERGRDADRRLDRRGRPR